MSGSVSMGSGGRQPRRRGWVRDLLPAILGLLLLAALGVGALLLGGEDDEPKKASATPAAETTPAPEQAMRQETPVSEEPKPKPESESKAKPKKREVRMDFRRIRGGLRGEATVAVRRTRPRHGTMTITARVPKSKLEVHLVKRSGPSKVLLIARSGPATVTRKIPFSTFRRYRSIDVLARRLPAKRGRGRVRSLRVRTARITRRLARRG